MRHIRLIVEYDGSSLCGWQRQSNGPTVQGHLEDALATLVRHDVAVIGASRTDAGVHARGQVASFRTERSIPLHGIRRGLNSLLPDAIAVTAADEVGDDFHPRFSATGKHYRYTILARPDRSPRWHNRAWHRSDPIDPAAMRQSAIDLLGEHDFSAFRAAGCTANTTVRRLDAIDVTAEGARLVVDVHGNAFLRNMVRILVGTLVEIGTGSRDKSQIPEIIRSRARVRAGITAPPQGLELIEVRYDGRRPRVV